MAEYQITLGGLMVHVPRNPIPGGPPAAAGHVDRNYNSLMTLLVDEQQWNDWARGKNGAKRRDDPSRVHDQVAQHVAEIRLENCDSVCFDAKRNRVAVPSDLARYKVTFSWSEEADPVANAVEAAVTDAIAAAAKGADADVAAAVDSIAAAAVDAAAAADAGAGADDGPDGKDKVTVRGDHVQRVDPNGDYSVGPVGRLPMRNTHKHFAWVTPLSEALNKRAQVDAKKMVTPPSGFIRTQVEFGEGVLESSLLAEVSSRVLFGFVERKNGPYRFLKFWRWFPWTLGRRFVRSVRRPVAWLARIFSLTPADGSIAPALDYRPEGKLPATVKERVGVEQCKVTMMDHGRGRLQIRLTHFSVAAKNRICEIEPRDPGKAAIIGISNVPVKWEEVAREIMDLRPVPRWISRFPLGVGTLANWLGSHAFWCRRPNRLLKIHHFLPCYGVLTGVELDALYLANNFPIPTLDSANVPSGFGRLLLTPLHPILCPGGQGDGP